MKRRLIFAIMSIVTLTGAHCRSEITNPRGPQPNHDSALEAEKQEIAKLLVTYATKFPPEQLQTMIADPFVQAAATGDLEKAKNLLKKGTQNLDEALKYASGQGHKDMVRFLLLEGAKPHNAIKIVDIIVHKPSLTTQELQKYSAILEQLIAYMPMSDQFIRTFKNLISLRQ